MDRLRQITTYRIEQVIKARERIAEKRTSASSRGLEADAGRAVAHGDRQRTARAELKQAFGEEASDQLEIIPMQLQAIINPAGLLLVKALDVPQVLRASRRD